MTEFADLGARCSLETCKQQDFLPFVCDACNRTFCLEHRCVVVLIISFTCVFYQERTMHIRVHVQEQTTE